MDLKLLQKDVANVCGVTECYVADWGKTGMCLESIGAWESGKHAHKQNDLRKLEQFIYHAAQIILLFRLLVI